MDRPGRTPKEDRIDREPVCWYCDKEFTRDKRNVDERGVWIVSSLCPPCLGRIR